MEREGGKEENERRITQMQNPAIYIFSLKERSNIIVEDEKHTKTDRTQNFNIIIEPVVARSTPVKRKCNLWTRYLAYQLPEGHPYLTSCCTDPTVG